MLVIRIIRIALVPLCLLALLLAPRPLRQAAGEGDAPAREETMPLIIAHRGASAAAPENTLAAFELAWKMGADGIEGDFYLTRDGHIVCIHDAATKRTAGTDLKVAQTDLAALRELDVGAWKAPRFKGQKIPTLDEVLATVPPGKRIYIEIKCGPEIVPPLKAALARSRLKKEQTLLISFNRAVIRRCKVDLPGVKAFWLVGFRRDKAGKPSPALADVLAGLKATGADGLGVGGATGDLAATLADELKRARKEFHVWTINDAEAARALAECGAASITTDCPDRIREAFGPRD